MTEHTATRGTYDSTTVAHPRPRWARWRPTSAVPCSRTADLWIESTCALSLFDHPTFPWIAGEADHCDHDWLPTLLAAAGDNDVSEKLKKGYKAGADGETEYKVHIDGFNLLPYLMGEVEHSPRRGFFYFNDDAELVAMRFENWKIVFAEQRCQGTLQIWAEPFTELRVPKLFNLRTDPFEYADITSNTYYEWFLRRDFFMFYATAMASAFLDTFKEFPPRHPPASFSIDQIVKKLDEFLAAD